MTIVQAAKPAQSRFEQRLEALDAFCRYLRPRLRGRLKVERTDQGARRRPGRSSAKTSAPIVSFGLDRHYFLLDL